MSGMRMFFTSESMILPNAAPMMTTTARSITLPLKAKDLNSSNKDRPFLAGSKAAIFLMVSMDFPISRVTDEYSGGEDQQTAEHDLEQRRHKRRIHEAMADPGNDGQFHEYDADGYASRCFQVTNQ